MPNLETPDSAIAFQMQLLNLNLHVAKAVEPEQRAYECALAEIQVLSAQK